MEQYIAECGIEVSIEKLRPGARYCLSGTNFVQWDHELPPPSWEEISNQFRIDIQEYNSSGGEIIT